MTPQATNATVPNKGPLTNADRLHLAQHVAENSRELLDEAKMLLERGRWARAGALAVLAVEEAVDRAGGFAAGS